ncbi:methyl-accepting chemotaxis protein [Tropicibacter sp. S64]|uniref:methyl-accepting chemotaxis protein n=1 Tax=Tropicibacter sp. S64 TaxID=3415122 RepID=UPI003C79B0F7
MSLRAVMLVALIPLVCLVAYLGISDLRGYLAQARVQNEIVGISRNIERVGDLVHELQKERGYSAGFTSSKGATFASDLVGQRSQTDGMIAALQPVLPELQSMAPEAAGVAVTRLDSLSEQRAKIDALASTVPELADYYTGIINALIAISTHVRSEQAIDGISPLMEAQQYVALAKESAGLERAMGATGLGAESFPVPVHQKYVRLAAEQMAFLARTEATLERPGFVRALLETEAAQRAQAMRDTILSLPYGGTPGDLTAPKWFAASTAWIDSLRDIEVALGGEIRMLSGAVGDAAEALMWREAAIVLIGSIVGFALAALFVDRITRKLRTLIAIMNEFIDGNFDAWVPFIQQKGELGTMAQAIYRFKQLSKEAIRKKETDEAQLNAKHQQVVDLVTEGLNALSQADLSLNFEEPLAPEYDVIRADFNVTVANLRKVMEEISSTVNDLETRAETMMHSASDLAQRTTQQVAQIEATVEATTRLSNGAQDTKRAIGSAKAMADEAKAKAQKSGDTVAEAVAAMDRISRSSDRIGQITTMIEDLSFQTNLLALNAGVEAARAGASGKGFAVVATEVRALASRSSDAAMEIKTLIGESATQIDSGVQLVDQTGAELQTIIEQILKIDESLSVVTGAATGQANDLGALQDTMQELRDLTARNLALADQSQNNSDALGSAAQTLSGVVSSFTFASGEAGGKSGSRPTRAA